MHVLPVTFLRLHSRASEVAGPFFEVCLSVGDASEFPRRRNMAYCTGNARKDLSIIVAPKMFDADLSRIEGVLRHEFGHALLFFWGNAEHGERDADAVAEQVFGLPIYYDRETVQTIRGGSRPRPAHLGL